MKKIVCYIDMLGRGGAQRVMSNLVTHFCNSGGKEVIFVNDFIRSADLPHYDVPEQINRYYLRKKRTGIPLLKNIQRISALRKILKKEKPDCILSFLASPNITTLLAGIGLKTRRYVSVRNDPNREYGKSFLTKFAINLLFTSAAGCIFQTNDASKYFWKSIRKKSAVIYNPVEKTFFDVKREENTHNIVTFGRLAPQKNHAMLIKAYASIADKLPDDDLYIYGDGDLKDELISLAKALNISERVHFPGNVSNIPEILSKAKLFVLPSDYEGMPNALMEAMATGTPSISTDCPCGGPRELFGSELSGYLVGCNDCEALTKKMSRVLTNGDELKEMSKKCKTAASAFDSDAVFGRWEEFIV